MTIGRSDEVTYDSARTEGRGGGAQNEEKDNFLYKSQLWLEFNKMNNCFCLIYILETQVSN